MAEINCNKCNNVINSKTKICPHCGYDIEAEKLNEKMKIVSEDLENDTHQFKLGIRYFKFSCLFLIIACVGLIISLYISSLITNYNGDLLAPITTLPVRKTIKGLFEGMIGSSILLLIGFIADKRVNKKEF